MENTLTDVVGTPDVLALARRVAELEGQLRLMGDESRLGSLLDSFFVFAGVLSTDGVFIEANRALFEAVASRREEVIGRKASELSCWVSAAEREAFRDAIRRAARGESVRWEFELLPRSGEPISVDFSVTPLRSPQGGITHVVATGVPVTERKRAEQRERLLSAIVDSSDDPIISKNLDGIITSWNKSAERVFGYSAEEAIGKSINIVLTGEAAAGEPATLERLKRGERIQRLETLRKRIGGSAFDASTTISPVKDAGGSVVGASRIVRDIGKRKLGIEVLRDSERRDSALFANSTQGICQGRILTDESGKPVDFEFIDINSGFEAATGLKREEVRGRTAREIFPRVENSPFNFLGKFGEVALQGSELSFEAYFEPLKKWFSAYCYSPAPAEFIAILTNITARKRAEEALRESEERFRTLADNISPFAWMADASGWIFWYNNRWYDYTGTTLEDLQGWGWRKILDPDHADRVMASLRRGFDRGEPWTDTFPLRARDGSYRWFLLQVRPIRDATGRIVRWFGSHTDITDLLETETRLKEREAQLALFVESAPAAIAMFDRQMRYLAVSRRMRTDLGLPADLNVTGRCHYEIFPETTEHWREIHHRVLAGEELAGDEDPFPSADGRLDWVRWSMKPWRSATGEIGGAILFLEVITERVEALRAQFAAEEQLRAINQRFIRVLESITDGFVSWDRDMRYIYVNAAAERILKHRREDLLGRSARDVFPDARAFHRRYEEAMEKQIPITFEEFYAPLGVWIQIWAYPSPEGLSTFFQDVTERRRTEAALRESEARFRSMFENAAVGMAQVSLTGRWLSVNQRLCEILGYSREELSALKFGDITHPDDLEANLAQARDLIAGRISSYRMEKRYLRKDGEIIWANLSVSLLRDAKGEPARFITIIEDISTRKHAENALRVSEATLASFFDSTSFLMGVVETTDNDILTVSENAAAKRYFGFSSAGHWGSELGAERADVEFWLNQYRRAQETKRPVRFEYSLVHRGEPRVMSVSVCFIHISRTGRPRFSYVAEDITSRKQAERALRDNEERLRLANLATREAIWDWDVVQDRLLWNPNIDTLFGWKEAAASHTNVEWWEKRIHPEDRRPVSDGLHAMLMDPTRSFWEAEYRFRRADDSYAYVVDRGYALREPNGRPYRMLGSMMDLTERRQMETALRDSETRFRALAEAVPEILFTNNPDGACDFVSPSFAAFTGLSTDQALGTNWAVPLHPDDVERTHARWKYSVATGEPFEIEYRLRRHDGVYHWFIARSRPIRDENNRIVKWFGAATDIEDQKQAESALRLANEDLNRFAFAAAHDLREPLRNVGAYSDMLVTKLGDSADLVVRRAGAVIREGVQRMDQLLSDLLEYSKVTDAASEDAMVDCNQALRHALQNLQQSIAESGAKIETAALPVVPGQESQFIRIFQNLIGNAIKYRGPDPPRVTITAARDDGAWLFEVRDNGIGIDPEFREHIFGMFKRLHGRDIPGTGIGLAICTKIVEARGGRIWVESALGQGSRFLFTWPVHQRAGRW